MYGLDDQFSKETTTVESDNAMDILSLLNSYVHSFDWDKYSIEENVWGFCCDSGNYADIEPVDNVSEVYWTVVNFGSGESKYHAGYSFSIEYVENTYGGVDQSHPVTVSIFDKDCGEYTNRSYTINPK